MTSGIEPMGERRQLGCLQLCADRRFHRKTMEACRGFHGASNPELRQKLARTIRARVQDFPGVHHYELFGEGGRVTVTDVHLSGVKMRSP